MAELKIKQGSIDKGTKLLLDNQEVGASQEVVLGTFALNGSGELEATGVVPEGSISNAELADMTAGTSKGRALGAGTGAPQDLTPMQQLAISQSAGAVIDDGNSGAAKTIDFSTGPNHKLTLTAACTLTFTAPQAGAVVTLRLIQDGTGGRIATFPGTVVGTPAYDTTATTGDTEVSFLYDGTNYRYLGTSMARAIVDVFTSSGTWRKRPGARAVGFTLNGGGGGGGSGRRGKADEQRFGGGGGSSGGALANVVVGAELFDATETVTVGKGGAGASGVTADNTDGSAGTGGGDTSFGDFNALGGNGGSGGTTTAGAGGTNSTGGALGVGAAGSAGGASSTSATAATGVVASTLSGGGGGGGGGLSAANVARDGGTGGAVRAVLLASPAGGTGGATGSDGSNGSNNPHAGANGDVFAGSGGGGGGAGDAGKGGKGGNGGIVGAAGGGGGASLNGNDSGAGGNGADGIAVIVTYF